MDAGNRDGGRGHARHSFPRRVAADAVRLRDGLPDGGGRDGPDADAPTLSPLSSARSGFPTIGSGESGGVPSRLDTDLSETKGWSYGVGTVVPPLKHRASTLVYAPVRTDRTGACIAAIGRVRDFFGTKGVEPPELRRIVTGDIRELPGGVEQSTAVLAQTIADAQLGRPTACADSLAGRYRALTAPHLGGGRRSARLRLAGGGRRGEDPGADGRPAGRLCRRGHG